MLESTNLKNRILKMREANKSDSEKISLENFNVNKKSLFTNSDISKENINKKKDNLNINFLSPQNYENKKYYNYDEQFKLLANKFNEAIEVILELSESVNKLESIVHLKEKKIETKRFINYGYKLKFIVFFVFIILISWALFYLPVHFKSLNIFLNEIFLLL